MLVVGIDFGTTNVRIATWDSGEPGSLPQPVQLGDSTFTMPAVIAFQKRRGGEVTTVVGEDADSLENSSDIIVVRNIKRWALASDRYVEWHLNSSNVAAPDWWDPETRSVRVWDRLLPVSEVIHLILDEAFRRAGISGDFQWRAGCPVQAGHDYRHDLARILSSFGGPGSVTSVVEEPLLFLELAYNRGVLVPGSYMVYDLGGGSFDCAIAEVGAGDSQMTVYASHGHPLLGGATIDGLLAQKLGYEGPPNLLRVAKEQLSPSSPSQSIGGRVSVSWNDFEEVLDRRQFLGWTLTAMREAYISAKVIWKWADDAPIRAIPSCRLGDMPKAFAEDLNAIILFGGSTKSPYFSERLAAQFGADRVIAASDLMPAEIPDPELTSLSIGACFIAASGSSPLYVNRLPYAVTIRDMTTGDPVRYEPYRHFAPNYNPMIPFISGWLPPRTNSGVRYELTITNTDGAVLESKSLDSVGGLPIRLVIDKLGRVWTDNGKSRRLEIKDPPWQTDRQRAAIAQIEDRLEEYAERERERVHNLLTENPFGWQSGHA